MGAIDEDRRRLRVRRGVTIPLDELTVRTSSPGGPGGQHANTANTRVEVVFDALHSPSLGPRQRALVVERLGPKVRAVSSRHRSQARNRTDALERLAARLAAALAVAPRRRPTRPTPASRERRLHAKRARSETKRLRRRPEE